jgi:hypothetical protein
MEHHILAVHDLTYPGLELPDAATWLNMMVFGPAKRPSRGLLRLKAPVPLPLPLTREARHVFVQSTFK